MSIGKREGGKKKEKKEKKKGPIANATPPPVLPNQSQLACRKKEGLDNRLRSGFSGVEYRYGIAQPIETSSKLHAAQLRGHRLGLTLTGIDLSAPATMQTTY